MTSSQMPRCRWASFCRNDTLTHKRATLYELVEILSFTMESRFSGVFADSRLSRQGFGAKFCWAGYNLFHWAQLSPCPAYFVLLSCLMHYLLRTAFYCNLLDFHAAIRFQTFNQGRTVFVRTHHHRIRFAAAFRL